MKILKIALLVLVAQTALASGPMSITVMSSGSGYGIEDTKKEAIEVAQKWAMIRAEEISEDELNEYDEDGYIPIDEEARTCEIEDVVKSSTTCEKLNSGQYRCDYEADFECSQTSWHEYQ